MVVRIFWNVGAGLVHRALNKTSIKPGMGVNYPAHRRVLLVGSQAMRYRHPIPPFRPYEIRSQLVFADSDWMYFLHQFQCPTSGKLYAEGLCRATCKEGRANVSAAKMYAEVFEGDVAALKMPEEMPDIVKEFLEWDASSRVSMESAAERAQREIQTTMPSTRALAKPGATNSFLARVTESWNLPF
ncbi:hypothetical protein BBJ28_00016828 [Nothophytophthora sp. Chile5]|nr:hypothetical protein BBJ28_00016828 [Nothophytophthora sp. Chile5]